MAAVLRGLLRAAEVPYTWAVRWRNRRYDRGKRPIERVGVPVVSVGNLTLGGTGKTPLVEWLARWFRRRDLRVTIVSRGYGAEAGARNDEALELEQKLPDVPHVQNPDRVAAARMAIEEFECQAILLDDAFQHRRIGRDLDIVLLDALEPFGFGHVFPRGMLREPLAGLSRADVVALSRANLVAAAERAGIREIVQRFAPAALWIECNHAPRELQSAAGATAALETLAGKPVAAFCGIGNPEGFRRTLDHCAVQVAALRVSRSLFVSASRRRVARRVGCEPERRSGALHAKGSRETRHRPVGDAATLGGGDRPRDFGRGGGVRGSLEGSARGARPSVVNGRRAKNG